MPARFLDTNVLVRHLATDDPDRASRALALLERADRREVQLVTSSMVIFETVFTLQKTYRASRAAIREGVAAVISLRGLRLASKATYLRALDLYVDKNISFADAYNATFMQALGLTEIYTWDTDFDRLEGITRVEPAA